MTATEGPFNVDTGAEMRVKINADRRVTIPTEALDSLGVKPGEYVEVVCLPDGIALRPERKHKQREIDLSMLGYLRDKIDPNVEPFDIRKFRKEFYGE